MFWEEVIGQERAKAHLRQMLDEGRVPHALMLCGPQGCGELALALALARELLTVPGNEEQTARLAHRYHHPDLYFVFPTIKKKTSDAFMTEWRTLITQRPYCLDSDWLAAMGAEREQAVIYEAESQRVLSALSLKSSMGGRKVLIVWRAEKMNQVCANKLLKLIEEPPEATVIIFVCNEPDKLLPTIQSRVQRIQLPPLTEDEIAAALTEQRGTAPDRAARLAHLSRGSMAVALSMVDTGGDDAEYLEYFIILMRKAYVRQVDELRRWAFSMAELPRERQKAFLDFCCRFVRENFMFNFRQQQLVYMSEEEEQFATKFARFINEDNVLSIMDELDTACRDVEQNVNSKMVFFDMALQFIILLIPKNR